jgi:hypothetical protein
MPKFLILQNYAPIPGVPVITEWTGEDVRTRIDFQVQLNKELTEAGLHEMAGDTEAALAHYRAATGRTTSIPEQRYLTLRAARLRER